MSRSTSLGEQKSVRLTHGTIRYRERGEGPPVVFVSGFAVNGDLWRNVVPAVAESHRCITPDIPLGAHEMPMDDDADLSLAGLADMVVEFLDRLELERVTLVGNDTGGGVVQVIAGRYPERVDRIVLTPSDCFELMPPPMFWFLPWIGYIPGSIFLLLQSLRIPALRRTPIAFGWLAKRSVPAEVASSYLSPGLGNRLVRRDIAKVSRALSPAYTQTACEQLRHFERPVLLVWPREDRLFPYAYAERLAALLPDATLVPVDDSYTFVPEDQPEVLAQHINEFLADRRARSGHPEAA